MFALQGTQIRRNISVCRCFPLLHWMWYVRHMTRFQKPNTSTYTLHMHTHTNSENTGIADEIRNGTLCVGVMCVCVHEGIPVARCSLVYARNRMEVKPNVKREHRKIEAQKEAEEEEEEKRMRGCYAQCFGMKQTWNGNQWLDGFVAPWVILVLHCRARCSLHIFTK